MWLPGAGSVPSLSLFTCPGCYPRESKALSRPRPTAVIKKVLKKLRRERRPSQNITGILFVLQDDYSHSPVLSGPIRKLLLWGQIYFTFPNRGPVLSWCLCDLPCPTSPSVPSFSLSISCLVLHTLDSPHTLHGIVFWFRFGFCFRPVFPNQVGLV